MDEGEGDGEEGEASILLGTGGDDDEEEEVETAGITSLSQQLASGSGDDAGGGLYQNLPDVGAEETGSTGRGDGVGREVDEGDSELPPVPDASAASAIAGIALRNGQGNVTAPTYMSDKVARCKLCGVVISRDMLAIEVRLDPSTFPYTLFPSLTSILLSPPSTSCRRIWRFAAPARPTARGVAPWAL